MSWVQLFAGLVYSATAGAERYPGEAGVLRKWLVSQRATKVHFLELYSGHGGLTAAIRRMGYAVAPPVDRLRASYGRRWDLGQRGDRDLVDLLIAWLEPYAIHLGLPCEGYSRIGNGSLTAQDEAMLKHAVEVLRKQKEDERVVTLENPVGSAVFQAAPLVEEIGVFDNPKRPWAVVRTDGCQYGMVSRAVNDGSLGQAVEKGQLWVANKELSGTGRAERHGSRSSTGQRIGQGAVRGRRHSLGFRRSHEQLLPSRLLRRLCSCRVCRRPVEGYGAGLVPRMWRFFALHFD